MRPDDHPGGGPLARVVATHVLVGVSAPDAGDAVAVVVDGHGPGRATAGRRTFVPSPLPCGECPFCRRALVSACRQMRTPITVESRHEVDVPERFLTDLTEPAWVDLPPATVAGAGVVAELLDATARGGLGPGDTAIWVGEEPWVSLGAAFSARRQCRTFSISAALSDGPASAAERKPAGEPIVVLNRSAAADEWQTTVAAAEAASGAGHGRPERRIFVYGAEPSWAAAALSLAVPGTTLSFRRGVPPTLSGLDHCSPLRVLVGGGYHPDLIAEALALLARGEVNISEAIREVPVAELDSALASFAAGQDRRFPLITVG